MHSHNSGRIIAAGSVIYRYSNQFFIKRMRELGITGCYPPYLVAVILSKEKLMKTTNGITGCTLQIKAKKHCQS